MAVLLGRPSSTPTQRAETSTECVLCSRFDSIPDTVRAPDRCLNDHSASRSAEAEESSDGAGVADAVVCVLLSCLLIELLHDRPDFPFVEYDVGFPQTSSEPAIGEPVDHRATASQRFRPATRSPRRAGRGRSLGSVGEKFSHRETDSGSTESAGTGSGSRDSGRRVGGNHPVPPGCRKTGSVHGEDAFCPDLLCDHVDDLRLTGLMDLDSSAGAILTNHYVVPPMIVGITESQIRIDRRTACRVIGYKHTMLRFERSFAGFPHDLADHADTAATLSSRRALTPVSPPQPLTTSSTSPGSSELMSLVRTVPCLV